jgi:S-formylglutathione hydrolase
MRNLRRKITPTLFLGAIICAGVLCLSAQARAGKLDDLHIDIPSLKGNLLGDPSIQHVAVYLPPSYSTATGKRYPVLYLLHGYFSHVETWTKNGYQGMNLDSTMDALIRANVTPEMIVVVPNGDNLNFGSFYTNSALNGNWEDYIYRDLVAYIDQHYRTIAKPESRGITGHSMGGYGALMLAMKHPDVFGAMYALSPCCIGLVGEMGADNPGWGMLAQLPNRDMFKTRPQDPSDELNIASGIAFLAAFSPDPKQLPLMIDFQFKTVDGHLVPNEPAYSQLKSKMPLYLVDQYKDNLLKLRGIAIDVGEMDQLSHIRIGTREFSEALSSHGIPHSYEIYKDGTHSNKIRERFEKYVIPFMARTLEY